MLQKMVQTPAPGSRSNRRSPSLSLIHHGQGGRKQRRDSKCRRRGQFTHAHTRALCYRALLLFKTYMFLLFDVFLFWLYNFSQVVVCCVSNNNNWPTQFAQTGNLTAQTGNFLLRGYSMSRVCCHLLLISIRTAT